MYFTDDNSSTLDLQVVMQDSYESEAKKTKKHQAIWKDFMFYCICLIALSLFLLKFASHASASSNK